MPVPLKLRDQGVRVDGHRWPNGGHALTTVVSRTQCLLVARKCKIIKQGRGRWRARPQRYQLRAGDLAGLQARRADRDTPPVSRGYERPDSLHVRIPPTVGAAMRVRDGHAEAGPFAADVADAGHVASL